jgi:hypothetical protein
VPQIRHIIAVGIPVYVAAWAAVALLPIPANDIDAFFWPSARVALAGHPLQIYQPLGHGLYPNANGPLSMAPLVLVGTVVRAIGAADQMQLRRAVILAFFSLFILLMAREAMATVDRLRGQPVTGVPRLLAYGAFTVAPILFQGLGGYGHVEQAIEVWMALLAARWVATDRPVGAGVALGLAVLARSSAGLLGLPLAIVARRRGPLRAVVLAVSAAVTTIAGLLPFFLADREDVVHSLLTYRSALPVGAGSVWSLSRGTLWETIGQHSDIFFIAGAAILLNLWLALWRSQNAGEERLYAGLALTSACFCLLAKTVWPYYLVEVYVFTAIWAFSRSSRPSGRWWRIIPLLGVSGLGLLAEGGVTKDLPLWLVKAEGATMFVLLGVAMLWMAIVAIRREAAAVG